MGETRSLSREMEWSVDDDMVFPKTDVQSRMDGNKFVSSDAHLGLLTEYVSFLESHSLCAHYVFKLVNVTSRERKNSFFRQVVFLQRGSLGQFICFGQIRMRFYPHFFCDSLCLHRLCSIEKKSFSKLPFFFLFFCQPLNSLVFICLP